jgi:hypothetical protein
MDPTGKPVDAPRAATPAVPQEEARPALRCLEGELAPPGLREDLARVLLLPAEAKRRLWHVLGPSVSEPVPPDAERLLSDFCRAHQLEPEGFAHAIKACRFLIRESAGVDLQREGFLSDLEALHPASTELRELLLAGFERAKTQVRAELIRRALADHGSVLVGVDWRIDTMSASSAAPRLGAPVAILTLRYREGETTRRLTLQVLPDMLAELKNACERILA